LELAGGEFLALLDPGDELASHALYLVAEELNAIRTPISSTATRTVSTRQATVSTRSSSPTGVPICSPRRTTCRALPFTRTGLVRRAGGFREEMKASTDYDLCLRCAAGTSPERIVHSPHVLYHRRAIEGSSAGELEAEDEVQEAGRRALQELVSRREPRASVELGSRPGTYRIRRPLPAKPPLVTWIIPTRDGCALLRQCLESIRAKTTYPNYDILIADNQSRDPETLLYFDEPLRSGRAAIVAYNHPFNYSAINNFAVSHARGELVALLNNDIEVIGSEWRSEMVVQALRPEVGAVGAKLYYPDGSVQHAGVIVGLVGVADHGHRYLPREEPGYFDRVQAVHNLSAVTAACLVVRRDLYLQVGGLDAEHLAVAFNDIDFCLRLRDAGYLNVWTPYAELIHHESVSRGAEDTPEKQAREAGEIAFMKRRWGARLSRNPDNDPADVEPEILIIDEILAVGDEKFQAKCMERINLIRKSGCTILYVSHGMESVRLLCSRVLVLHHGQVVFDGPPDPAIERYRDLQNFHPAKPGDLAVAHRACLFLGGCSIEQDAGFLGNEDARIDVARNQLVSLGDEEAVDLRAVRLTEVELEILDSDNARSPFLPIAGAKHLQIQPLDVDVQEVDRPAAAILLEDVPERLAADPDLLRHLDALELADLGGKNRRGGVA
jgi:GT2 family glycosyltransferase